VNTVVMFFSVRTKKLPSGWRRQGSPGLEYTHQPWSSPREEGLRSKWTMRTLEERKIKQPQGRCRAFPATASTCDNLIWLPLARSLGYHISL
jgi:hypothetical protein